MLPQDTTPGKRCSKCGESKPPSAYYIADKRTGRLYAHCKACHHQLCERNRKADPARAAAQARARYRANPEVHRSASARYRAAHRAEVTPQRRERDRQRYAANREAACAERRAYRKRAREHISEQRRAAYAADPEPQRARQRAYHRAHPETAFAANKRRKARIMGGGGTFTAAQWRAVKARYEHRCLMCGRQEPAITLTPDHVIPLARGGPNTIENIQPLCGPCNNRKNARILDLRR